MILAFDTATDACTLALGEDNRVLASKTVHAPRGHLETLLPLIDQVLAEVSIKIQDVDYVASGSGPGSFTGIRIAVSTARGLAQAKDIPLVGISTLDILAYGLRAEDRFICPVIDAKRGQVYFSVYESDGGNIQRMGDIQSLAPDEFCSILKKLGRPVMLAGDALEAYGSLFKERLDDLTKFASPKNWFPDAKNILPLADEQIKRGITCQYYEIMPIYVRVPIAEESWQKRMKKVASADDKK